MAPKSVTKLRYARCLGFLIHREFCSRFNYFREDTTDTTERMDVPVISILMNG